MTYEADLIQAARERQARLFSRPVPVPQPKAVRRPFAPRPLSEIVRQFQPMPAPRRPRDWLILRPSDEVAKEHRPRDKSRSVPAIVFVPEPTWVPIAKEVCAEFGVSIKEVKSHRRDKYLVIPRRKLAWRLKRETSMTIAQIGRVLCRDHTTVIYHIRKFDDAVSVGAVVLP